jgi:hypothetical protein
MIALKENSIAPVSLIEELQKGRDTEKEET